MQPKNNVQTIDWIQALRGMAAVLVVLTHARVVFSQGAGQEIAWKFLVHGAVGVDLFFIISGFIMVLTTQNCDGSARYCTDFVIKRFSRIWPLLFVVSVIYFFIAWGHAGVFSKPYVQALLSQLIFKPVSPSAASFYSMPVDLAWTLCFEAFFYFVIAISLCFGKYRWWVVLAILSMGLVIYPAVNQGFNFNFYTQPIIEWNHYLNLAIHPVVWDFVYGLIAGKLYISLRRGPPVPVAIFLLLLALLAFISIPYTHQAGMYGPTIAGGGMTMFFAFVMILLASKSIKIPVAAWMIWLGTISYSLYLTHRIGFIFAKEISRWLQYTGMDEIAREWVTFSIYVFFGVLAGALFHKFAEVPLSDFIRRRLKNLVSLFFNRKRNAGLEEKVLAGKTGA
ncbi:acyltransferase [Delftia acidovorans]|uniref:acyltransferase family protein n=1 Tax=Delftia acidovorans TaxID=80866 RepID=UPI001EFCB623|nr:acyltransferase [Delftia acidovorans]MCG8986571.1 acyltransferase [Delftia acidovorans]